MNAPKRIQMSRQRPWRAGNPDAVIVSRGTSWGNQFPVGGYFVRVQGLPYPTKFPALHDDAERIVDNAHAIALWRERLDHDPGSDERIRRSLKGRDLACWCSLDEPCHADVLLEIANGAR